MREFFHGWRRKVGCVTLLVACALAGMWVRSLSTDDYFDYTIGDGNYRISSTREYGLSWIWWSKVFGASPYAASLDRDYGPIVLLFLCLSVYLLLPKPLKNAANGQNTEVPHA